MNDPDDVVTGRRHLTGRAYANEDNLARRQSIYQYRVGPGLEQPWPDWVLAHVTWRGGERAADCGCGNGTYLPVLDRLAGSVVAFDLSAGMLDAARTLGTGALGVRGDIAATPFASGSFDVVVAAHVLYHLADVGGAVAELRRVLRRGGVLVTVTNGRQHTHELTEVAIEAMERLGVTAQDPLRPALARFTLENAPATLGAFFDEVTSDVVHGRLEVPGADPVIGYLESIRYLFEPLLETGQASWESFVDAARQAAGERISRDGAFVVTTHSGVLICR